MLTPSALLDPSVPYKTVIEEARKAWHCRQMGEYVLCLALRRLRRDEVHRGVGLSRIQDYAEYAFGVPPRLGSLFSDIGRQLKKEGREHKDTKTVKSPLNGEQVQTARRAREVLKKEGEASVPEPELLPRLLDMFAQNESAPAGEEPPEPARPTRPYLAIHLCPKCLHTWVPVARENMELSPVRWIEEMRDGGDVYNLLPDLLCDCEDVIHRRDECPRPAPRLDPTIVGFHTATRADVGARRAAGARASTGG